ncbi:MAG: T9SS type A sorting domain-containing protein, partial [Chitinophagales bacterium]|nr:T9SS type A sorting domain-containing protein [Chitinophagales bacterium]
TTDWGNIATSAVTFTVLRKDAGDIRLRPTNKSSTQARGGIFVPFSALGFSDGQVVYGYSLMGFDVTATSAAQILDYTNSTLFPLTTTDINGGLDIIGVTNFFELIYVCYVLPIQFQTFTGTELGYGNELTWKTATEKDNLKFEIEYSENGYEFVKVGEVSGAGNSTAAIEYSFYHSPATAETGYYRLRQVDFFGDSDMSPVIMVKNSSAEKKILALYPNPVNEYGAFVVTGLEPADYTVRIYSTKGELMRVENFKVEDSFFEMDVHDLPKGQYMVRISAEDKGIFVTEKLFVK